MKNSCLILSIVGILWLLSACDGQRVFDQSAEIPQKSWHYDSIVPLACSSKTLRHTTFPSGEKQETRVDLPLADKEGKWYGKGAGDVRSTQVQLQNNAKMPDIGMYLFEVEQNMRQNPLREVMDIGLRIEKASE